MRSMHLISDLDGTWIHPRKGPAPLRTLEDFLETRPDIVLTFATGRTLDSALNLLEGRISKWPEHLITDVGTALHHRLPDGTWEEDGEYASWVDERWDGSFLAMMPDRWIPEGICHQAGVHPLRRIALETRCGSGSRYAVEALRSNLMEMGARVDVLVTGRCVDVLPKGVHKGTAARFLHRRFGLPDPLVACGDAENDLGLFSVADTAVLMPDGPLCTSSARKRVRNAFVPLESGPAGILQALQSSTLTYTGLQ